MTKASDGYVERLHRYATLLPQATREFIEECADLLEFYEEQNESLLKRQEELLGVADAARAYLHRPTFAMRVALAATIRALDDAPFVQSKVYIDCMGPCPDMPGEP